MVEQAFYACIDMGQNDLAETYLNRLSEQFPGKITSILLHNIFAKIKSGKFFFGLAKFYLFFHQK